VRKALGNTRSFYFLSNIGSVQCREKNVLLQLALQRTFSIRCLSYHADHSGDQSWGKSQSCIFYRHFFRTSPFVSGSDRYPSTSVIISPPHKLFLCVAAGLFLRMHEQSCKLIG